MKHITKILITVVGSIAALLSIPAVQQLVASTVSGHKTITSLLLGVAGIAALLHDPKAAS